MEKNIQKVSYKSLIFKKPLLKAHSSKPDMSKDAKNIMCLLQVSSPNQNRIVLIMKGFLLEKAYYDYKDVLKFFRIW